MSAQQEHNSAGHSDESDVLILEESAQHHTLDARFADLDALLKENDHSAVVRETIQTMIQKGVLKPGDQVSVRLLKQGGFGKLYEIVRRRMVYQDGKQLSAELPVLVQQETCDALKALFVPHFEPERWRSSEADIQRQIPSAPAIHMDQHRCIVMEYLHGADAASVLRHMEHASTSALAYVALQSARLLQDIARVGYVHRDFKPANMHIDAQGEMKLLDFGLARRSRGDAVVNLAGEIISGTLSYMPPEQLHGKMHKNTDVFALGCTLFELYTHENFFQRAMWGQHPDKAHMNEIRNLTDKDFTCAIDTAIVDPFVNRLLHGMLCADPCKRMTIDEVVLEMEKEFQDVVKTDRWNVAKAEVGMYAKKAHAADEQVRVHDAQTGQIFSIPHPQKHAAA